MNILILVLTVILMFVCISAVLIGISLINWIWKLDITSIRENREYRRTWYGRKKLS